MPYPFNENPLDSYLLKHRRLKAFESVLLLMLAEKRRSKQPIKDIQDSLASVSREMSELDEKGQISPRVVDIFFVRSRFTNQSVQRKKS